MKNIFWLLFVATVCVSYNSYSATYYISPSGSNSRTGTSSTSPWLTWSYASSKTKCGDTLIALNGTYTVTKNGRLNVSKLCSSTAPYTIKALNERQAVVLGDGRGVVVKVNASSNVIVSGLYVKNVDNKEGLIASNVTANDSSYITFRRLLVTNPNRFFNNHLIQLTRSPNSLIEENELYFYHRHGIIINNTNYAVVRRNYCNSRGYPPLPGSYSYSGVDTPAGDSCVTIYPGNYNIVENNISEGPNLKGYSVQALGSGLGNRFYGNISLNPRIGISLDARVKSDPKASALNYMPRDTIIRDMVVIGGTEGGIRINSAKNTRCDQCTVLTSKSGVNAEIVSAAPGDGVYSFYGTNILSYKKSGYGLDINSGIQSWQIASSNSYLNTYNFSPITDARFVAKKSIDPKLGACKVWIPATSSMKKTGSGGKDIGANILYRYKKGVLTTERLWAKNGEFPRGAFYKGINDVAGKSAFDVHKRLNVNTNGCAFPAGYY